MKQFYTIRVNKGDERKVEKTLLMCLVDRMSLCAMLKSIELNSDSSHSYFIIGGEKFSCTRVLSVAKKALNDRGVDVKIYNYNSMKNSRLDDLVWNSNFNEVGKTIKTYYNNPIMLSYLKKLTTKFVLKKGLFSNHVFCPECDGFADAIELNSVKGIYKCSFCDADVIVEGPILNGNKPISHLSTEEQLYLIGKPSCSPIEIGIPDEHINGEQVSLINLLDLQENISHKIKRRRKGFFYNLDIQEIDVEQLYWNIIV